MKSVELAGLQHPIWECYNKRAAPIFGWLAILFTNIFHYRESPLSTTKLSKLF